MSYYSPDPLSVAKALAVTILLSFLYRLANFSRKRLPPGPRGYPIIGNLLDVPQRNEGLVYRDMSRKYNSDIIYLNICGTSIVVVNSLEVADDLFDKRSSIYSNRPRMTMVNELDVSAFFIAGFDWHIAFMPYGDTWKEHRTLFHKELQPPATLLYRPRQLEAIRKVLLRFLESPDDYLSHLRHMVGTIILSTAYGIDVQPRDDPYVNVSEKSVDAVGRAADDTSYLVNQIPALKYIPDWFPGARFKRQAKQWRECAEVVQSLPMKFVKESMAQGTAKSSIASRLLSSMDEDDPKAPQEERVLRNVLATIYVAGGDTTVAVIENFILAVVQNPEILKKGQKAVDDAIGTDRLPDFGDQKSIPYVDALMKEVLRWRPITPLAAPHCVMADDEYRGYHIPAGSTVIGNAWAMLYDEAVYGPDTHLYNPERFLTKEGKLNPRVKHPETVFGFGRRQCPGMDIAESTIWMTIASILACFDIVKSVDDEGFVIEPEEGFSSGLVVRPKPFECTIRPRSTHVRSLIRGGLHETF
ncbi:cytochrome P450 [Dendrothele bispora CBS 962.96]|uniref:Cytochrome P450 n=1 Tax=Dendrothele bispora (strain CBS 962.96) TaxID=1314807 RepID=A0A4S8LPA0_DENBC|nr:cytochrome P450 [Dendrothele bispora CBS 962.96]